MDKERLNYLFPFSAVMGRDDAKLAIEVALISDTIRTVLIQGVSGSAKSVLIRSIPCISDTRTINIPPAVQAGQVFGELDIERTIKTGKPQISEGLLSKSNGNILLADDVNLMDRNLLLEILESIRSGNVMIEREGISGGYDCDTKFFATMNTLEYKVDPHILDQFDLCVNLTNIDNEEIRYVITERMLVFERNPAKMVKVYGHEDLKIVERIANAKHRLPFVSISDDMFELITALCSKLKVEGHRGDITLAKASMAIAALDCRDEVTADDVKAASKICLSHRANEVPEDDNVSKEEGNEPQNKTPDMSPSEDQDGRPQKDENDTDSSDGMKDDEENNIFTVGNSFHVIDFVSLDTVSRIRASKGGGKHKKTMSDNSSGRYIRAKIPGGKTTDFAFDATLRAAAPHQRYRQKNGTAIAIHSEDIRQKVREKKNGISTMFVVDASGSMGARKRMIAVKGAVLSLLQDSYKNRDRVSLISFRRDSAETLLTFTKSVDFAYRKLKEMPTGGSTPLAIAMMKAEKEIIKDVRSNPTENYYIILITDGRANVSMSNGDAFADAMNAAKFIAENKRAIWVVVDTSTGFPHLDNAIRLCEQLGGIYLRLEQLNANALADRVRTITRH